MLAVITGRGLSRLIVELMHGEPKAWISLLVLVLFFTGLYYFRRWFVNR